MKYRKTTETFCSVNLGNVLFANDLFLFVQDSRH